MRPSFVNSFLRSIYPVTRGLSYAARPAATPLRFLALKPRTLIRSASSSPSEEEVPFRDFIESLNENPELKSTLQEFRSLLLTKGLNTEKPPSMMEMMRILGDSEVREMAKKLKGKFDDAGIQFTPDQMNLLMSMFKK